MMSFNLIVEHSKQQSLNACTVTVFMGMKECIVYGRAATCRLAGDRGDRLGQTDVNPVQDRGTRMIFVMPKALDDSGD
jgi:hypothetical protein